MNDEQQQANFEGFGIVQQMGHKTVAGYVTTEYFGGVAVFRVVQQEQPPEEVTLDRDGSVNGHYLYAGSKVRVSRPRAETYIAVSSLYALTPCTESEANARQPKTIEIIERAERKALAAAVHDDPRSGDGSLIQDYSDGPNDREEDFD